MMVSVIVPIYNQLPFVLKLSKSISLNRSPSMLEVILIDDASPEFNLQEHIGHPFTVIRNQVNRGFVASENIGAKQSSGDLLLFLNSDIEVRPGWLDPMVSLIRENDKIGIVGPKLVFPINEQGESIQSAGGLYDAGLAPFHRYIGWKSGDPHVNKCEKVSWVTGAALLTRRSLFDKIGGFDEAYGRGYYDDPDYCEKAKSLGYEVWYQPASVMVHSVGKSMEAGIKTEAQKWQAVKSFRSNALKFHSRWDSKIKPDVNFMSGAL